jgi:outer membrane protein assembly factor BamB
VPKHRRVIINLLFVALSLPARPLLALDDWSQFRGTNASGVSDDPGDTDLPTNFGPDQNVVWKTPLPAGHSSPVLTRDRIFVTAHDANKLFVISLDRANGKVVWRYQKSLPNTPSPLFYKDTLYLI